LKRYKKLLIGYKNMVSDFTFDVIKIFLISFLSCLVAFFIAPQLLKFLNKVQFWKKKARTKTITGEEATVFHSLHKEREVSIPRGGGLLIWVSVLLVSLSLLILSGITDVWRINELNFLSERETLLPLFALIVASIIGLVDDILTVYGKGRYIAGGIGFAKRLALVSLIGLVGGLWFLFKLQWTSIHVPLIGDFPRGIDLDLGVWFVLLFILVTVGSWAGGVIDGLDGLAGGVFSIIFGAFAIISFSQGKADLAALCLAISGTLFAFLWFNIPPARFYMGETGILGLTSTMAVVAFLTDSVMVLPIIAGLLVLEVGTMVIQLLSKKFRHKKIWLSTPIHHHFEALGWPAYQVTMRFWIIGVVLAILGVSIRLLG